MKLLVLSICQNNCILKNQIEEINAILGQQQIENIINTIKLINSKDKKTDKISNMKSLNIQKCIRWCNQNNIPYYENIQYNNVFLKKIIVYNIIAIY